MTAHDFTQDSERSAESSPKAGYVYLSVSYSMPGFVQIDTSPEDPTDLTWSLRTMSGVTHFRSVAVARAADCPRLVARFRAALGTDQIPNHSDLFKIPIRFARQILEDEARQMEDHAPALPSLPPPPKPPKRKPYLYAAAACAATITLAVGLAVIPGLYSSHRPMPAIASTANTKPAAKSTIAKTASPLVAAATTVPAPAPRLSVPQFRVSGAPAGAREDGENRPGEEGKIASTGVRIRNSSFALR
jgi:hypothetical protein